MEFTPQELWEHTGTPVRIVIFTMFFMALACMYVAIERACAFNGNIHACQSHKEHRKDNDTNRSSCVFP